MEASVQIIENKQGARCLSLWSKRPVEMLRHYRRNQKGRRENCQL